MSWLFLLIPLTLIQYSSHIDEYSIGISQHFSERILSDDGFTDMYHIKMENNETLAFVFITQHLMGESPIGLNELAQNENYLNNYCHERACKILSSPQNVARQHNEGIISNVAFSLDHELYDVPGYIYFTIDEELLYSIIFMISYPKITNDHIEFIESTLDTFSLNKSSNSAE